MYVFVFLSFCLQNIQYHFYDWNVLPQSNAGLKDSLAQMYMATFILRSSNLERQEKESITVVEFVFSIGENFDTHTHTHIFVAFLKTGSKNGT